MGNILFHGIQGYNSYRRSVDARLPLTFETLHFFTKEYLGRQYIRLTADEPDEAASIPSFRVFADEGDLESLESRLPGSGKTRYISGHIQVNNPPFSSKMQFRYRGGLPLHWLYEKKSLRVKLPPYVTFNGERQFNLVNPSTTHTITDWISYGMARSVGLLTPDYFPARVYINNAYNGFHFFLSRIDESFLRKNHRMPGSIYSGDTIYTPDPFGVERAGVSEATYKDKDGMSLMWKDYRLWGKGASRNAEMASDRTDIQKYIDIINISDPFEFMREFEVYFDKEKYYLFWGLDTLVGGYHHDNFHNHKIYFDPYKGRFEPIEWDLRFWSSNFRAKDIPLYPLLHQIKLNPILEFERDLVGYSLLERFNVADVKKQIDKMGNALNSELKADPVRQAPDARYGRFTPDKVVPFSMREYASSIDELKVVYQARHDFLHEVYKSSSAVYYVIPDQNDNLELTISVTGNSPIELDLWALIPVSQRATAKVYRIYNNERTGVPEGTLERLYPGRVIKKGNVLNRSDNWSVTAFGKEKLVPSPLHYHYAIEGISQTELNNQNELAAVNAITGDALQIMSVSELPSDSDTASVHPWHLMSKLHSVPKEVVLSGEITLAEDRIFTKEQLVKILPGTIFRLSKGSSLIFYGKVVAEGTEASPIEFRQLVEGEPWGSVVIQGDGASGSRLSHIHVNGGSITTQRLVRYPGQINIHDVSLFQLDHCTISNNHIGDDSLHVAYSKGEISQCHFEDTAFDALDMDISEVAVSDLSFVNIGNDALDLMTSNITITDVVINGTGDKCVSVGEESKVKIQKTKLNNCVIGIAVKDQSQVMVDELYFQGNKEAAISLYQKNSRYSKGGVISGDRLYGITIDDIVLDAGSTNYIPVDAFKPFPDSVHQEHAHLSAENVTK